MIPPSLLAGKDVRLPRWLGTPPAPKYDSVVVCGNGIGALCVAARLARSESFAGRVVLAGPPIQESRRLIGGLTLRARALDYYCVALDRTHEEILQAMFGDRADAAATTAQHGALCVEDEGGSFTFRAIERFMDQTDFGGRTLAYGVRNSRMTASLRSLMDGLDFAEHPEVPRSLEEARSLAGGRRPLVINATPRPLGPSDRPRPTAFVTAAQTTFCAPEQERVARLPVGSSFVTMRHTRRALDLGVYYPLYDALSPRASYYGIFYRVVAGEPDREQELGERRREVIGVGRALGLEPENLSETLGEAVVPCTPWTPSPTPTPGFFDLYAHYNAGAPIITGDGMTRAGLGAVLTAEAILAGEDPAPALARALVLWRGMNRGLCFAMTRFARPMAFLLGRFPKRTLGQVAGIENTWAGVA